MTTRERLRRAAGLNLREVAALCGVSHFTIRKWEGEEPVWPRPALRPQAREAYNALLAAWALDLSTATSSPAAIAVK